MCAGNANVTTPLSRVLPLLDLKEILLVGPSSRGNHHKADKARGLQRLSRQVLMLDADAALIQPQLNTLHRIADILDALKIFL